MALNGYAMMCDGGGNTKCAARGRCANATNGDGAGGGGGRRRADGGGSERQTAAAAAANTAAGECKCVYAR